MFGIQWDLTLKYLEVNGDWDIKTNEASYYLKTNSGSWGNYRDVEFQIEDNNKYAIYNSSSLGEWKDVLTNYNKPSYNLSGNGVLLSTGATDRNNKMNIYDLAGNVYEWTIEKSDNEDAPCVRRGGNFGDSSSLVPVSYHHNNVITSIDSVGFRSTLF